MLQTDPWATRFLINIFILGFSTINILYLRLLERGLIMDRGDFLPSSSRLDGPSLTLKC